MKFTINPARQGGELLSLLPKPQKIYFADPHTPPIEGFLLLRDQPWQKLETLLERYILEHTLFAVKQHKRDTREPEKLLHNRTLFFKVVEDFFANASVFDQGQGFPETFLLGLLRTWAKMLPDIPQLAASVDPSITPAEGVRIQLGIFTHLHGEMAGYIPAGHSRASRLWTFFQTCPDWVLEREREEPLPEAWPFGEVYYGVDPARIRRWYAEACAAAQAAFSVPRQRAILPLLFDREQATFAQILCAQQLLPLLPLPEAFLPQWEKIALGLVYGDIFRDAVSRLQFCARGEGSVFLEQGEEQLLLHDESRPLQFSLPGVVHFRVKRFCLRYEVQGFSSKVEQMGLQEETQYRRTLEQMENFQREVLALCREEGLIFEKYLGNGGFITTRNALKALQAALALQAIYKRLCGDGFFFSDGFKIALHHAPYSMLPVLHVQDRPGVEFYGRGMVELDALMSDGHVVHRDHVVDYLKRMGVPGERMLEVLDPLSRPTQTLDVRVAARDFYCVLLPSGQLFNRGIVATMPFVEAVAKCIPSGQVCKAAWDDLPYLGVRLEEEKVEFGMRFLGICAHPKMERVELVEISPFPPVENKEVLRPDVVGATITQVLRLSSLTGVTLPAPEPAAVSPSDETRPIPISKDPE